MEEEEEEDEDVIMEACWEVYWGELWMEMAKRSMGFGDFIFN